MTNSNIHIEKRNSKPFSPENSAASSERVRLRLRGAFDKVQLLSTEKQPRYAKPKYPKRIQKPAQFLNIAQGIIDRLSISIGGAVQYQLPDGQSRRYTDYFLHKLEDHGLIKITNGQRGIRECVGLYTRGKNKGEKKYKTIQDWIPRKLYPSPLLVEALRDYYPTASKVKGCCEPLMERSQDKITKRGSGRFHAKGLNNYQNLKRERRALWIDGDKDCVEADINASFLRALLSEHSYPNYPDPYRVGSLKYLPRDEVKTAILLVIGSTAYKSAKMPTSWYQDPEYGKDGRTYKHHIKIVVEAVLEEYPFLEHLPKGTFFELTWRESNVISRVLTELANRGITGLSMHDGIIVRRKFYDLCKQLLEQEYEKEFKTIPVIKAKAPNYDFENLSEGHWNMKEVSGMELEQAKEIVTGIINAIMSELQVPELTSSFNFVHHSIYKTTTGNNNHISVQNPPLDVNSDKPAKIRGKHGGLRRGSQLHLLYGVSRAYICKLRKKNLLEQYIEQGKLKPIGKMGC